MATNLVAGDIAFINYDVGGAGGQSDDQFAFVVLKPIDGNTVIFFTDRGVKADGSFVAASTREGTIQYTAPAGGLSVGDIVVIAHDGTQGGAYTINGSGNLGGSDGASYTTNGAAVSYNYVLGSNNFDLGNGTGTNAPRDQVIAYQGAETSPTFIAAISTTAFISTGTPDETNSYLPTGLTAGDTAIVRNTTTGGQVQYAVQSSLAGTPAQVRAELNSDATWSTISRAYTTHQASITAGPVFTSSATASPPENSTFVETVSATNADGTTTAGETSFSIVGGADAAKFTINATSGALSFVTAPDFEAHASAAGTNAYAVQVQALDTTTGQAYSGTSATQNITVNVADVNDNSPVFATATAAVSVQENTPATTTVYSTQATDADTGPALTYSLGGADAAKFILTTTSGVASLKFAASPDYEAPGSAAGTNTYQVNVVASDSVHTATQNLTVNVTDVNDNSPVFAAATAAVSVQENTPTTTTVYSTQATDADSGPALTYSLSGADASKFVLTTTSGVASLKFAASPDYEAPGSAAGTNTYQVNLVASDSVHTTTQNVTVTVTDANDNSPVFPAATAAVSVQENTPTTTTIYSTQATDADTGPALTYSLSGADASKFVLTTTNGVASLKFAASPDYEAPASAANTNTYQVNLVASDSVHTTTQNVTVNVTDVNDNAPVITSSGVATEAQGAPAATPVYTVTSTDADASDTATYSISGGPDAALFNINAQTGAVTFKTSPNFNAPADQGADNVYNITVRATDAQTPGTIHTTDKAVAITVTNAVVNAPTVVGVTQPAPITEAGNAAAQDIPATPTSIQVRDADTTGQLTATTTSGATATLNGAAPPAGVTVPGALVSASALTFAPVATNGAVVSIAGAYDPAAANLDFLAAGDVLTLSYPVTVSDSVGHTATTNVVVTINGTNDAPVLTGVTPTATVPSLGSAVLQPSIVVTDADRIASGTGAQVSITQGFTAGDRLTVTAPAGITAAYNAVTGVLTLSGAASDAAYQQALRSVTFTHDGPVGSGTRTVAFSVTDDQGASSQPVTESVGVGGAGPVTGGGGSTLPTNLDVQQGFPTQFGNLIRATATDAALSTPTSPLYAQSQAEAGIAASLDTGRLSSADAQNALYHLVDGTTSVAEITYAFFTGKTPTQAGLNYLVHSAANANDLNDPYYAQFTTENRYINFANNLATGPGAGAAAFQANYGSLSLTDATAKAYAAIFGTTPTADKISAILTAQVSNGLGGTETRAQYFSDITGGSAISQKAAAVGFLLADSVKEGFGLYQQADLHFLADLAHGTAVFNVDLLAAYGAVPTLVGQALADPTLTGG